MNVIIGIYKITSPKNEIYIGQSWDIENRIFAYKGLHCKGQKKLYNSIKKYQWETHKFEVVHELPTDISQKILDNYEVFYWQQYKDCGFKMMNIKEPGKGGRHSEQTKKLISQSTLGKKYSEESKQAMSRAKKGKLLSEEHKKALSNSAKNRRHS